MAYLERDAGRGNIEVGLIDELADRLDELLEQAALLEAGFEHGDCPRAQLGSAVCTLARLHTPSEAVCSIYSRWR